MADFRKSLLLAAMAVAVGAGTASAQSPSCVNAPSAAPELRSEGQTELTGAIVLTCTNIATGQSVNIDVLLNGGSVPITSRETPVSEATLTVTPANGAPVTYSGTYVATTPNTPVNDVRFLGVATPTSTLQITIAGIRANVNPTYVPLSTSSIGSVLATVSASNGVLPIQVTGGGLFVGLVTPGLGTVSAPPGSAFTVSGCAGAPPIGVGTNFAISIPENFPTAFKPQGPVTNQDSETGQNFAALQAESGTQLAVTFSNIPAGLTFYIPQTITSSVGGVAELVGAPGSVLGLVSSSYVPGSTFDLSPTAPTFLNAGASFFPIAAATTYYYNVTAANPSAIDSFTLTTFLAGAVTTPTTTSTVPTVLVTLAPPALVNGAQQANVPRFIALSTTPTSLPGFSVSGCQTTLLFPYMTNQAGFDTGFSIAATSTDPFGTFPQGGTCTLYMYGTGAPATAPTLVIPQGAEGHNTVSAVAPGFQGYVMAVCPFEYAHGYAFLSNGFSGVGNGGLSEGYLALEVGNSRVGTPSTAANGVYGGESLGH